MNFTAWVILELRTAVKTKLCFAFAYKVLTATILLNPDCATWTATEIKVSHLLLLLLFHLLTENLTLLVPNMLEAIAISAMMRFTFIAH